MDTKSPHRCEFDPAALRPRKDITVPGEVSAIQPAVAAIMAALSEMGCAGDKDFEIELAITEALANAVVHGCGRDARKQARVIVECDPQRGILVIVRDPGRGFDPTALPSPVHGERLFARSGRGIYLINQLMDEVRFEKGGTEIWMVKK